MNGDLIPDFAAAGPGRLDGEGYAREISVSLSGAGKSDFTVRSLSPSIQLSLRDVDGDHDRDLVILESWSLRPIGVWLNDGTGHFEEGNLAEYSSALGTQDSRSLGFDAAKADGSPALHAKRFPYAERVSSDGVPDQPGTIVTSANAPRAISFDRSHAHPRAPPFLV